MRPRILVASLLALGLPAVVFVPFVVSNALGEGGVYAAGNDAGPPSAARGDGGRPSARSLDPNNQTNISPYMQKLVEGNGKYLVGDYPGAIATYRDAIPMQGPPPFKNALGHYLLGEALFASGNAKEAEEIWRQGDVIAGASSPVLRARILFCLANLKEQQKAWPEARAAWVTYSEFAAKVPPGDAGALAFPASGTERVRAIDAVLKLDKDYEIVRQRIREYNATDGGIFSTPDAQPG